MQVADVDILRRLVERLRSPDGCPWDRKQGLADLRPFLLEEAHEAADAIDRRDWEQIGAELGDLLFQVAFLGQLAHEAGAFSLAELIERTERKMIDRHPHVFGDEAAATSDEVEKLWQRSKTKDGQGVLDGVPASLPALVAAQRIGQKAAGVGFDWPDVAGVRRKVAEELDELDAVLGDEPVSDVQRTTEEIGDLLFAIANLARRAGVDPEAALSAANRKFTRRFTAVEERVRESGGWRAHDLDSLEALWQDVKSAEPK